MVFADAPNGIESCLILFQKNSIGDLPIVTNLTDIDINKVNSNTIVYRAVSNKSIDNINWEVIGHVVKSKVGNSIVFVN
jgi:hypothetical protein